MSVKCNLPIYTLPMLSGKTYVVTSIDLVNAVNRNSKILAFNPFIAFLGKRITGHDETTSRIVQHNLNGENGQGYVIEIHDGTVSSLASGPALNDMTANMLAAAMTFFDRLKPGAVIDLFAWTKRMVTLCSTQGIYGKDNPFNTDVERMVRNFWQFDEDLNTLILDFAPAILAPKGNRARQELGRAFSCYFDRFDVSQSSPAALTKHRYSVNARYELSSFNQGRLEVGVLLGILANTIPTIFYTIVHVLSDAQLLEDVRGEIEAVAIRREEGKPILQVLQVRENCALLYSTLQETLRVHAQGSSVRYVREDIVLQERWLLKKGMVVQMPQAVMHSDPGAWGPDVGVFNPRRFLKQSTTARDDEKAFKPQMAAYRPFGGGTSLCPGRHFVTMEAMILTAVMVMGFEVIPVQGHGWKIPTQKQESMATNVFPPDGDIKVEVRQRRGWEGLVWEME
ncbi:MAG: hypothetical protein LQ352_003066 [Teloschistes flavicans]|nr:MAG: hypothetical protein LQ352_003066 [Teloschistes flavicans]